MAIFQLECYSCKTLNEAVDKVGFREDCSKCGADLHICLNCEFYDKGSYHECRESSADFVKDKERANYCDYFRPRSGISAKNDEDKVLSAAEALFKKN